MGKYIGIDIGGTKIAGAMYDEAGHELAQITLPTPDNYPTFLENIRAIVAQMEQQNGRADSIGVCSPFLENSVNMPFMAGKPLSRDLEKFFDRPVPVDNDANCAALAEAMEGAGKGYNAVFGLIFGTGVGGGFVVNGHIIAGANGMCGEIGHLPLPFYEESDGDKVLCGCGQYGCIEKLVAGGAVARLYQKLTGKNADARQIAGLAQDGDVDALRVLDRYFTVAAKAMVAILHSFDPDIITVSGGLNALPGLYEEVTKRWGQFAVCKNPKTKLVPATFGSMAGLRGAAWLGRNALKR